MGARSNSRRKQKGKKAIIEWDMKQNSVVSSSQKKIKLITSDLVFITNKNICLPVCMTPKRIYHGSYTLSSSHKYIMFICLTVRAETQIDYQEKDKHILCQPELHEY